MALVNNAPLPLGNPIAKARRPEYKNRPDPQEGQVTKPWADYFSNLIDLSEKFPGRVANVELTGQRAAIGATDMTAGTLTAGLYRVSVYLPVTAVEALSDVTVTIDWQDGGVTRTRSGAVVQGNSTANYDSFVFLIRVDALTPVRYATTYTALGTLQYALHITLEEVMA